MFLRPITFHFSFVFGLHLSATSIGTIPLPGLLPAVRARILTETSGECAPSTSSDD